MEASYSRLQHYFFLILFLCALILILLVFRPFLSILVLAFALAILFKTPYEWLVRKTNGQRTLSAFITIVIVIVVVLIPLIIIGSLLFDEVRSMYVDLAAQSGDSGIIAHILDVVQTYVSRIAPGITIDAASYIQYGLEWITAHLNYFFSTFFQAFLNTVIMVIALFYFLRDGAKLKEGFMKLSPLADTYDESIIDRLIIAINSVVKGSIIIAIIQGSLAGLGTAFAGLPNPVIWGLMAAIASFVPGLGTGLVIGPAIIYLFATGQIIGGTILLVWQLLVVAFIDNFLTPHILKRGMKIHPFFILLSVLGGIALFGPIGFIMGPLALAFFFALLDIYPLIIRTP